MTNGVDLLILAEKICRALESKGEWGILKDAESLKLHLMKQGVPNEIARLFVSTSMDCDTVEHPGKI